MLKTRKLIWSLCQWTFQSRTQAQYKSFKHLSNGNQILPKSRSKSTAASTVENEKDIEELTHFGYQQVNEQEKSRRGDNIPFVRVWVNIFVCVHLRICCNRQ